MIFSPAVVTVPVSANVRRLRFWPLVAVPAAFAECVGLVACSVDHSVLSGATVPIGAHVASKLAWLV